MTLSGRRRWSGPKSKAQARTVTVPFIVGWIAQKYANSPCFDNVVENVPLAKRDPTSLDRDHTFHPDGAVVLAEHRVVARVDIDGHRGALTCLHVLVHVRPLDGQVVHRLAVVRQLELGPRRHGETRRLEGVVHGRERCRPASTTALVGASTSIPVSPAGSQQDGCSQDGNAPQDSCHFRPPLSPWARGPLPNYYEPWARRDGPGPKGHMPDTLSRNGLD